MYMETKHFFIQFMEDIAEGKARTGLDIILEPAWRKSTSSSNRTEHVQRCNCGWVKKKYNPLGSDGKISLIIIVQFMGVLQTYCGWVSRQLGKHS